MSDYELKTKKCLHLIDQNYKKIISFRVAYKGINSMIIKILHPENELSALKIYPQFKDDKRNRLKNENILLKFFEFNEINNCPKLKYSDSENNFSLLSWIEGGKIKNINEINLEKISDFFNSINNPKLKRLKNIPYASEANFSLKGTQELILQITNKKKFEITDLPFNIDFRNWFVNDFVNEIVNTSRELEENYLYYDQNYKDQKIISQSDVGFHNILVKNKKLFFIDFEYAGWDNPMKFISDWILQPDSFFLQKKSLEYFQPLVKGLIKDINWKKNIKPYLLLYRLRWCLIISNKIFKQNKYHSKEQNEVFTKLRKYYLESKIYINNLYE